MSSVWTMLTKLKKKMNCKLMLRMLNGIRVPYETDLFRGQHCDRHRNEVDGHTRISNGILSLIMERK